MSDVEDEIVVNEPSELVKMKELVEQLLKNSIDAERRADRKANRNANLIAALNN